MDRTVIFQPARHDAINLLDRKEHENYIRYVYDAEDDKLLTNGRKQFDAWQKELNSQLDVGQRVIGIFRAYGTGLRREDGGWRCRRLHPQNAEFPDNYTLYTIERREDKAFIFLYERDEQVWVRGNWYKDDELRKPKVRASRKIYSSDDFILPFDVITEEECNFYLSDRLNRHHYIHMFPLLKTILKLKAKEREDESPFRQLLIGEIMHEHKATLEDAEAAIGGRSEERRVGKEC